MIQKDKLRTMVGVRRNYKIRSKKIRKIFGASKGVEEVINETKMRWHSHTKK